MLCLHGGIRFSSKHAFCLHFVARLPGVCCARIYARRLVLCVVQTANCPMIQESIRETASKEGRGRISQGGSKGKPDSPPFKNIPKTFQSAFVFFRGPCKVCQNEQYESPSSPPTPPTRQKLWETFPRPSGTEWDKWEIAWWLERHYLGLETGRGQTCTAMVAYSQGIIEAIVRAWQLWESTIGPRNFETLLWWWQWRSTD